MGVVEEQCYTTENMNNVYSYSAYNIIIDHVIFKSLYIRVIVVGMSIYLFVNDQLTNNEEASSRLSRNSEATASEFRDYPEEVFLRYYMQIVNGINMFKIIFRIKYSYKMLIQLFVYGLLW